MTKTDLVALSATYSTVITMDGTAQRRRHLDAMARYLDAHEALAGNTSSTSDALVLLEGDHCGDRDEAPARRPRWDQGP